MINNLPTYKIKVNPDDESGVYAVSLVDEPAIEVDWIHFSKIVEMEFAANKDKQMLFGPLLIPGKLIFRRDTKGNEYNIVFDEETIQLIADKFNENKLGDVFNFQHSDKLVEAILLQNWITGEIDKSQEFGFSLPQGTWFGGVKVKDESFWLNDVKSGKVKGFSVEIKAGLELVELNKTNIKLQTMEIKTNEGVSLYYEGEIAEGTAVFLDEAMTEFAPEGAHMLEDKRVITLDGEGVILSIAEETPELPGEDSAEELEEVTSTEEVSTELALDPQEVIDIVAPMFEEMRAVHAELMAKMAELEAKIGELENGTSTEMEQLKSQVETLAKTPAVESLSKKSDDKRIAKEAIILNKINAFARK
jgi:hypothetical protein